MPVARRGRLPPGDAVEIRVLGPVEIRAGDRVVDTRRPQQRLLMAALAVDAGRPVTVETLVDRVWDDAPTGARRTLHVLMTGVRRALDLADADGEPVPVVRRDGGYALHIDPDRVDVLRYRRLVAQVRASHCPDEEQVRLLREALGLWRGEPLSGLSGRWASQTRQAWCQQHLDTTVAWAWAELRAGDPAAVVGPLTDLAGEHPLVESLTEVLMRALHAVGRAADSLTRYDATRKRLAEELGTDPAAELQALYQQILHGQLAPPPATARQAGSVARPASPVPRQLPAPMPHFTGRATELETLTGLLDAHAGAGGTVVICAIGGTAGVGKTALAVYWGHQIADRFPDGQIYVNLRGFGPSGSVMDPAEAVRRFLDALDVPAERIPADLDAQAALYRSQLAGLRMLIVLDNARDTAQIRPLLPGTPGCLVLVTSRNELTGLIAADGAHTVALDLLTPEEARQLLACRLGSHRMAAQPQAVTEIITRCARLPLALTLVAARAAVRPYVSLQVLADELRNTQQRWETLTGDDPTSDVQAVFSWSYQALTPDAARLFRLLGLHPGPDLAALAAASLAALPPSKVRPLLAKLTRASLLVEHIPGRYTFHDLLRAYATDLTHTTDPDEQRRAATGRILDHYLHTAFTADRQLNPARDPITLAQPRPGVTPEHPSSDRARDWFITERPVLLTAVDHAARTGFDTHTWQLTWTLVGFLDRQGRWHEWVAAGRTALAAAYRLADLTGQARTHQNLARAYTRLGRFQDAQTELRHTLTLSIQIGDQIGQAHTYQSRAQISAVQGRYAEALEHDLQALDLFRAAGHHSGIAFCLLNIGWNHARLGDHRQSLTVCEEALALCQQLGIDVGQAGTWRTLGYAHHHLGHHPQALTCYQHAVDLFRDVGDRYQEATTLTDLGDTHHTTGNPQAARDTWQRALAILDSLDHPDADQVRTKLATATDQPPAAQPPLSGESTTTG